MGLFGFGNDNSNEVALYNKAQIESKNAELKRVREAMEKQEHDHKLANLEKDHKHSLDLKEKEFELKHFKDEELKKVQEDNVEKDKEIAVLKKENELLVKITDLNGDVIDVKDLVKKLIDKLPEVKVDSITVNAGEAASTKRAR